MNYIIVEGPDYAGKSTLVSLIHKALVAEGYTASIKREPGSTPMSEKIRALTKDCSVPRSIDCELLLMMGARVDLIRTEILPAIDRGEVIISDRGNPSTCAYQAISPELVNIYAHLRPFVVPIEPLYIFLDVSYAEMCRRKAERAETDAIEQRYGTEEAFNNLRKAYDRARSMEQFALYFNTDDKNQESILCQALPVIRSHLVQPGQQ